MYSYVKSDTEQSVFKFQSLMQAGTPAVFFDFETTGLTKNDRIIQIGATKVQMDENGIMKSIDSFNELINPGFHIPEEASSVNNIHDEDVAGHMDETEAYRKFRKFLGPRPLLSGYNSVSFDSRFLTAMYMRQAGEEFQALLHLDVLTMAREKLQMKSYKLAEVAHELGCDMGITFHDAFDDITATIRVFQELIPMYAPRDAALPHLPVNGTFYQSYSHTNDRIYVNTYPKTKTYYDIYRKKWMSDMDIDLAQLREDTLRLVGAEDEQDMIRIVKTSKKASPKVS